VQKSIHSLQGQILTSTGGTATTTDTTLTTVATGTSTTTAISGTGGVRYYSLLDKGLELG
jgi:hypothetical protein